ncbi:unnamed protein product [Schistosoma turkestanicum]|nr:unnamed protein product [Schistosoma turkestanicum]
MNYTVDDNNNNNLLSTNYVQEINEFPFTISQVGCMCEVLIKSNQIVSLRHLLNRIPKIWLIPEKNFTSHYYQQSIKQSEMLTTEKLFESRELILIALAMISYEDGNYTLVYQLLEYNHFNERHQSILQQLWYKTHYAEVQKSRDRPLTAVDKYRIRRKYPLPETIWDGEETVYCFKQNVRRTLTEHYQQNKYPNSEEKYKISLKTGLTFTQVSNWFKNHRQRDKSLELTDVHPQFKNKDLHNTEFNCYHSSQFNKFSSNNNTLIKQHEQSITSEFSIETYRTCNSYLAPFQSFSTEHTLPANNNIDKNLLNSSLENKRNSDYDLTTISYPISSSSCKNPNTIWLPQWTIDQFNIEHNKYNFERNYYMNSFDYNQYYPYFT